MFKIVCSSSECIKIKNSVLARVFLRSSIVENIGHDTFNARRNVVSEPLSFLLSCDSFPQGSTTYCQSIFSSPVFFHVLDSV